jgi:hypothetical protein
MSSGPRSTSPACWRPPCWPWPAGRTRGLGAHQAGGVHRAGRHRRRRRPDGALHPGRGGQEQADEAAHRGGQQVGGAGAEGFLDVKGDKGNPHKIIITLSNLFTTPLATGVPFNWRDMTPVQMLALDQFVLWVNEESPHKTAKDFFAALKAAPDRSFKMGGTGSKQEDQIITVLLEKAAGKKITYVPSRAVATWPCNWWASTSTPRSTTPSRPKATGAPASCARCACSTRSPMPYKDQAHGHAGLGRHAALQPAPACRPTT